MVEIPHSIQIFEKKILPLISTIQASSLRLLLADNVDDHRYRP